MVAWGWGLPSEALGRSAGCMMRSKVTRAGGHPASSVQGWRREAVGEVILVG